MLFLRWCAICKSRRQSRNEWMHANAILTIGENNFLFFAKSRWWSKSRFELITSIRCIVRVIRKPLFICLYSELYLHYNPLDGSFKYWKGFFATFLVFHPWGHIYHSSNNYVRFPFNLLKLLNNFLLFFVLFIFILFTSLLNLFNGALKSLVDLRTYFILLIVITRFYMRASFLV